MKKLVLMLAIAIGTTAVAQERKSDRKMISPEARMEKMTKELDLSPKQQKEVKALFAERKAINEERIERKKDERKKDMKARKAEMQRFDKDFKSILNEKQIAIYDAKKEKMKEHRKDKRAHRPSHK